MFKASLLILSVICFLSAYTDIKERMIPNDLIKLGVLNRIMASALGSVFYGEGFLRFLYGILAGTFLALGFFLVSHVYKSVFNRAAFGGGDIKLIFVFAVYFDLLTDLKIIFLSLILGSIFGLSYKMLYKGNRFPFAPAICGGVMYHAFFILQA